MDVKLVAVECNERNGGHQFVGYVFLQQLLPDFSLSIYLTFIYYRQDYFLPEHTSIK